MKASIYLILNRRGIDRTAKTDNFTLQPDERAFRLEVEVDDAAFKAPRVPVVKMTIPAEQLMQSIEVQMPEDSGADQA